MPNYDLATGRAFVRTGGKGRAPIRGNTTKVFVALLPLDADGNTIRTAPTQQNLTIATGGGDGTTLTVTETIAATIPAGQYLLFENTTTGESYLVKVAADVSTGSDITIETAVADDIPDGAVAQFPALLWDRTDASYDPAFTEAVANTFNTGGFADGVSTGGNATMTLPGLFVSNNAAYLTALQAAYDGREVYVQRQTGGRTTEGPCGVTAAPSASPSDGFVSGDLTVSFRGQPTEVLSIAD